MRFDRIPREVWFGIIVLFMLSARFPPLIGLLLILGMIYFSQNMINNTRNEIDQRTRDRDRGRYSSYDDSTSTVDDYQPRSRDGMNARQRYVAPQRTPDQRYVDVQPTTVAPPPQVDHVAQAISRAGQDMDELAVLPLDLGVLVYKDERPPQIYRMDEIPDDIDYLQPFVELDLPSAVTGRVRFEITDGSGQTVFIEENSHRFHEGSQPVVAQTRLPIHDAQDFDSGWHLKIYAEDMLLADHQFAWNNAVNVSPILQHVQEDGEMSAELREILTDNRLERMSLDELLDFQEEDSSASASSGSKSAADYSSEAQRQPAQQAQQAQQARRRS
jgi:hypothetical protein